MADRMEREIEEILSKLDVESPGERTPISIMSRKKKARPAAPLTTKLPRFTRFSNPAALLLAGAAIMVAGLVLSNVWGPLIWMAFGGVVIFLGAFVLSFRKSAPAPGTAPSGHYWRDRYIEYQPARNDVFSRIKRRLRR